MDEGKYISHYGDIIEIDGQALSLSVCSIIAKRYGMIDKNTTYAQARAWLASDEPVVIELLKTAAAMMKEHADEAATAMGDESMTWAQQYYEAVGIVATAHPKDVLQEGIDYINASIDRLCSTEVVGLIGNNGEFLPFDEFYKAEVDNIIRGFTTGQNTQDEIKKAAQRLAQGGLRVQYASGRTMNVYSAVRQTATTEIGRAVQDMRTAMGHEYGANGVEVSAHSLCAPDHLPYQARQFSNEEFDSIQASLERPIARGYNCHHTTRPIIMGVSLQSVDEELRQKMIHDSEKEVSYVRNGKEYTMTAYEGTQYQRGMENSIRKMKMQRRVFEDAGLDTSEFDEAIESATREYEDISEQLGLRTQKQRLDIYELSGD